MWIELRIILFWISCGVSSSHVQFIARVAKESSLSVLVIRNTHCPENWLTDIFKGILIPVVTQSVTNAGLRNLELSRPLHVVCMSGYSIQLDLDLLQNLDNSLKYFRDDKILLCESSNVLDETKMESVLHSCYHRKILNVIGLQGLNFYRYHPYPSFRMEKHRLDSSPIFNPNFPNMLGQPLIVMPDQWLPRSILYMDRRSGKQILAGSVGRFIHVLVWKLNATLQLAQAITPGRFVQPTALQELGKQLAIDVSASMSMVEHGMLRRTSYPLEMTRVCLMIPLAQTIPRHKIYSILSNASNILLAVGVVYAYGLVLCFLGRLSGGHAHIVDFLLNDRALRGVLGQSFRLPLPGRISSSRWIYLMLGIVGLNVSSIFEAALETMMAHPPREFQARSFADLRNTRLPLVTTEEDLHTVVDLHLNLMVLNVSEYNNVRSGGNASHAYFASRLHWTLFSEQQKRFSRELFIYSPDACLYSLSLLSFQWPTSSWFAEPVSKLILEVRANGLFEFWVKMHHYDMTEAGLAGLEDPSLMLVHHIAGLTLGDLQWVWLAYGLMLSVSLTVFLLEINWRGFAYSRVNSFILRFHTLGKR
ncbi:hypothetical protein KR009_005925 [Drosophila setifemur]|nr:hypothetical protein KR009_005925 [Drosophila setifemur]